MAKSQHKKKIRGRPHIYSPTVVLRCFVIRIWLRLDSNRSLPEYLAMDYPYNKRVLRVCLWINVFLIEEHLTGGFQQYLQTSMKDSCYGGVVVYQGKIR